MLIYVNKRFKLGARPKLATLVSAARFHVKLVRKRTRSFRQEMFHVELARFARSHVEQELARSARSHVEQELARSASSP